MRGFLSETNEPSWCLTPLRVACNGARTADRLEVAGDEIAELLTNVILYGWIGIAEDRRTLASDDFYF